MTDADLEASLLPLQERSGEPDAFPMRGCTALLCIMGCVLIALLAWATPPGVWAELTTTIQGTR